jgi:UDP-N-acetylglucosamine 2-epimerase
LQAFEIVPDHDLNIMIPGQSLAGITSRALNGLDEYFSQEKPDAVIAQGDTTTTFVASLASFYHKAAFCHVEAGLRTGNRYDPFPEEMNRLLTTRLTTLHFPPTQLSANNLLAEGVDKNVVFITGNTVIDALLTVAAKDYVPSDPVLRSILDDPRKMILVTAHRRENWGEPMVRICKAVRELVETHENIFVVFSLHRNPIVRESVYSILGNTPRVSLIEPPDYVPFVKLQQKSTLILTDSGGVQEEAPSLGKPVLVMRNTTERPEGIETGSAKLVGADTEAIVREASELLTNQASYDKMSKAASPYGDGQGAKRIVDAIEKHFRL